MRPVPATMLRHESASLEMTNEIATPVIPKLGLEMEGKLTIPTHVETTLSKDIHRTMEGEASKPWDISWCSRLSSIFYYLTVLSVHEKSEAIKGYLTICALLLKPERSIPLRKSLIYRR